MAKKSSPIINLNSKELKDIKEIKNTAKKLNAKIITTEKDYLRLNKLQSKNINFLKVKLVIQNKPKLIKFLKHRL